MPAKSPHRRRTARLPFVLVNMAMTADGKIATANRKVSSFASRRDFEHLLALRATADAVICGARTVDAGDVDLGPGPAKYRQIRISRGLAEYNLRIIVSGSGSINPGASIFRDHFSPIVILTTQRAPERQLAILRTLADEVRICGDGRMDFSDAFAWLKAKWGVERLLCEGGGELNAALFQAGLVQELNLTICPKVFGGRQAPTIAEGANALRLIDATHLRLRSRARHGEELFLIYDVIPRNIRNGSDSQFGK